MADKMKRSKLSSIRIKTGEIKKKIPREILTMDFPSALGCSRLPAKVRTYKIYSYRVKLRKSRKERKFQRKPMEGIEEDIRWSGETRGKWSYCSGERWRFRWYEREKLRKTRQALVGWHVTGIFARVSASNNGRCSFNWRYTQPRCSHVSWSRIKACCNGSSEPNRTKAADNGDVRFFCIGGDYGDTFYKRFPSNERVVKIATRCVCIDCEQHGWWTCTVRFNGDGIFVNLLRCLSRCFSLKLQCEEVEQRLFIRGWNKIF